ncbi:ECF RNA polymerase sigma factor SigK [Jongsikchunia kroppenstedtii]|uniref:ECF RNA polymerase sigma factor SigK n=1 Tax=Jongsikchunia kroppenstedtii TaxID=1121721 RepID=UPI00037BA495|nr:ECF RNA polymerase sigma factor SigK [Jongsikchunia kroppenstedtii]
MNFSERTDKPSDTDEEYVACAVPGHHRDPDPLTSRLISSLGAIADGDRDAFVQFYDDTCGRVFGLASRILRNSTMAEEVAQEVYLQVWTSAAEKYDPAHGSPMGWLLTLAHRRSVDRVRSEQSAADRHHAYASANLGREHDAVAEQVAQNLDEQQVIDCLDSLTVTQREVIGLAYYSGHTYREVAEHLDVPLPTIKSRIRDGLIRLKNCLGVNTDA